MSSYFPEFSLRQLTYFVETIDQGTMTSAATTLHVSQGAVSLGVADLESALGCQLFIRQRPHGLELTGAGRRIEPLAREMLRRGLELQQEGAEQGLGLRGPLRVGCYSTLAPFVVPRLTAQMTESCPGLDLIVAEGHMPELLEACRKGEVEVVVCYDHDLPSDIATTPLARVEPYVLLAPTHPLARRREIDLSDLAPEPYILLDRPQPVSLLLGLFPRSSPPVVSYRTSSFEVVRSMVARGLGYSVLIQRPTGDSTYEGLGLACRRITPPPAPYHLVAGVLESARPTKRAQLFIEECQRTLSASKHRP